MEKLKPCPICGRKPKIHFFPLHYARIQCKPWYSREPHLKVYTGYCQPSKLMDEAVKAWNAIVGLPDAVVNAAIDEHLEQGGISDEQ